MTAKEAEEKIRQIYLRGKGNGIDRRLDVIEFLSSIMENNVDNSKQNNILQ